jgi:predicted lactoylglutathione lyase
MPLLPTVISLPVADRLASFTFYREVLGLDAIGEPAGDGVPEPLQFALGDSLRLMLIPTGGFGWIIGEHEVAPRGLSECAFSIGTASDAGVDELVNRAHRAGAAIVTKPGQQRWGYAGAFADPDGHVWLITSESFVA